MYGNAPPIPPPKPGSHETSRISTPAAAQSPRPAPPLPPDAQSPTRDGFGGPAAARQAVIAPPPDIPDPGDQWLPRFLEDKSKQDLAHILSTPALLSALTHAPQTRHASLAGSTAALTSALDANVALAAHVAAQEARVAHARADAQARLLGAHAAEHAWRAKQAAMDAALAPFAPASLYQRLGGGLAEQAAVCDALEESFLDAGGGGQPQQPQHGDGGEGGGGQGSAPASERELLEWVRRYREAKKLYYLRQEKKERWDEGRVGGWR